MRVIGIDPGTRVAGYAVVDKVGRDLRCVEYGAITAARNAAAPLRLKRIYEGLEEVIARHKPEVAAMEETFYGKSAKSAIRMGEGRGIAILAAAMAGLPVHTYAATLVKKAAVGVGSAHKSQVQQMVRAILNLPEVPEPEDAADALAIAICHCNRAELLGEGPRTQNGA